MKARHYIGLGMLMTGSVISTSEVLATEFVYDAFQGLSAVAGNHSTSRSSLPEQVPLHEPLRQLRSITFGESGDEPCYVATNDDSSPTQRWNQCGHFRMGDNVISGGALQKIRVCFNNRSDERGELVKGVESMWLSSPFFGAGSAPSMSRFARTHCQNWSEWVECPANSSAGGLVLHHKPIDGRESLVGLQLSCYTSVEANPSEYRPAWNRQTMSWTSISGARLNDGTNETYDYSLSNEPNGNEYFLSGLGIKEETDEPVNIGVFGHHSVEEDVVFGGVVKLRTITDPLERVLQFLYPANPQNNERRMGLAAGQFSGANSGYLVQEEHGFQIRGVGVCLSRSQKVKGLRVNFVRRNNSGTVIQSFTKEESLTNCHEWQASALCDDRESAVGIRMLFTRQKGLTGIRLQCARIFRPDSLLRP